MKGQTCSVWGCGCNSCQFEFVHLNPCRRFHRITTPFILYNRLRLWKLLQTGQGSKKKKEEWKSTYVAAAETCPLLVRWAPKCICIHLSRQQRSGWKQNYAQEDTCSRARALAAAKGSRSWTPESSHLRISSWCCDSQQISPNCPNLSFSGPLRRSFAQRKPAISVPDGDAPAVLIKKKKRKNRKKITWKEFGGLSQC